MAFEMAEPFVRTVPPGTYDVFVSIWGLEGRKRTPSDGMGDCPRAAYLALVLSGKQPDRYEFAATGTQPTEWQPTDFMDGFGVDVGGIGIIDAEDLDSIRRVAEEDLDFIQQVAAACDEHPEWGRVAGCYRPGARRGPEVLQCDSGWGDGSYFSYWGLGAAGNPVVLIVDMDLENKWEQY
jgi:hypothetical protein